MWVQERTNGQAEEAEKGADERPLYITLLILGLLVVVGVSIWQSVRKKDTNVKVNPVTVQHQTDKPVPPMRIDEQATPAGSTPGDLQSVERPSVQPVNTSPAEDNPRDEPSHLTPHESWQNNSGDEQFQKNNIRTFKDIRLSQDILKSAPDFLKGLTSKLELDK